MKRIHVVGRKNSGKTTLIVELVRDLTNNGFRVATIKHTHHQHELDTPGKDSHQHREAGATVVGILSPGMTAVFRPSDDEDASSRYDHLLPAMVDCDIVLVEGDSQTDAMKIEVWRSATSTTPLANDDKSILALVTDDQIDTQLEVLPRSSVPRIVTRILELLEVR